MNFSVVVIAKNEATTLPKLVNSLADFKARGGEIIVLDTGSTDDTVQIATNLGCKVTRVGDKYTEKMTPEQVKAINERFVVGDEALIVNEGDTFFNYAAARNHAASLASNDMVSMPDCDEIFTRLDVDYVQDVIAQGFEQLEFNFVFAHDGLGNESIKFMQCKFYDRRKLHWEGIIHEVLQGEAKRTFLPEDRFKIEHFQEDKPERKRYLAGLALDCFSHPDNDRNSHYLARELLWSGRPKSAIKEFERHIAMDRWPAERAQSMIFIGDCYGMLKDQGKQIEWYLKAFALDGTRREALMKLAFVYKARDDKHHAAAYAGAALQLPWDNLYMNDLYYYTSAPHEVLYWARGWMGDVDGGREHLTKALEYCFNSNRYLHDTKYYFEYPDQGIEGWMTFPELTWLFETAKKMTSIVEIGSWCGRSTHALLSGCKGKVIAVDTFEGTPVPGDWTYQQGIPMGVYEKFKQNVGHFPNLEIMKMTSKEAAEKLKGQKFDMIFIDATHTKEGVLEDIALWRDKAKLIISGHDYKDTIWMGVQDAVDESFGTIDGVADTIWHKYVQKPLVSIIIPTLGRGDKFRRLLKLIKENAGYDNYEIIVKHDQFPPNNTGVPKLVKQMVEEAKGELVMYLGNDCMPRKDFLQKAVFRMIREYPDYKGLIGLNDGYWKGEFATHWLAGKALLPALDGEFFHTGYYHTGCDNELTERCKLMNAYTWAEEAEVFHDHPIQDGFKEQLDPVYTLAYKADRVAHDHALYKERAEKLGFAFKENFPWVQRIPKRIFTIWLGNEMPELVKRCIESQKIPGYEHVLITDDNAFRDCPYMQQAMASDRHNKWVKMSDYLRMYYIYNEGGIYLDADVEILPGKNFDELLKHGMFAATENNGFIGSAVFGACKGQPFIKDWIDHVVQNFRGDDEKNFESSMEVLTKGYHELGFKMDDFKLLSPDYFYPYDHQANTEKVTENTIVKHHFLKSWVKEKQ